MQDRVGRSSCGGYADDGVLEGLARQQVAWPDSALEQIHHQLAGLERGLVLGWIHRRNSVVTHGRKPDEFHHRGHRVGSKLASTAARARARSVFQRLKVFI